jgi:hypothetical protein
LKFFDKDVIALKQVKEALKKEGSVEVHKLVKQKIKNRKKIQIKLEMKHALLHVLL